MELYRLPRRRDKKSQPQPTTRPGIWCVVCNRGVRKHQLHLFVRPPHRRNGRGKQISKFYCRCGGGETFSRQSRCVIYFLANTPYHVRCRQYDRADASPFVLFHGPRRNVLSVGIVHPSHIPYALEGVNDPGRMDQCAGTLRKF